MSPAIVVVGILCTIVVGVLIGVQQAALAAERARNDGLVQTIVTMRQTGFTAAKPAKVIEPKDEEAIGLAQMEASTMARRRDLVFIENAAEAIMRETGVTKAQAVQEAARLRREMNEQEDSPL